MVLNRSGKSKRDLKGVGGCLENWEILSWPLSAHGIGEESRARNRQLQFAPRNVFGLCRCLHVLLRSIITKQSSKGVSRFRENWEILFSCIACSCPMGRRSFSQFSRERPTPFELCFVVLDRFDASKHLQRPKTFRGANRRRPFRALPPSCGVLQFYLQFSIISATADPFRDLFRDSGPIQHQ